MATIVDGTPRASGRKRRILQQLNRKLHMEAPLEPPDPVLFSRPKNVERWTYYLRGKPTERIIIYLRSDVGCQYGVKTGGCMGCRHWRLGTAGTRVDLPNMYVKQYRAGVEEVGLLPVVCIYNEGNMLNSWELPTEQLVEIVRDLSQNGVQRLVLESRCEHITEEILGKVADAANGMEIEMGIGLESINETVRNEIFLKGMTLRAYERAVAELRRFRMRALAYVIVKPPFVNEAQAIDDAVATAEYAFQVGTAAVSLEPIGVEPHTVTDLMHKRGRFTPAWLWSVIEIARRTKGFGELRIGGFQFSPLPVTTPKNCDECTERVLAAIDQYNLTYELPGLEELDCAKCRGRWQRELNELPAVIDEDAILASLQEFVDECNADQVATLEVV